MDIVKIKNVVLIAILIWYMGIRDIMILCLISNLYINKSKKITINYKQITNKL